MKSTQHKREAPLTSPTQPGSNEQWLLLNAQLVSRILYNPGSLPSRWSYSLSRCVFDIINLTKAITHRNACRPISRFCWQLTLATKRHMCVLAAFRQELQKEDDLVCMFSACISAKGSIYLFKSNTSSAQPGACLPSRSTGFSTNKFTPLCTS